MWSTGRELHWRFAQWSAELGSYHIRMYVTLKMYVPMYEHVNTPRYEVNQIRARSACQCFVWFSTWCYLETTPKLSGGQTWHDQFYVHGSKDRYPYIHNYMLVVESPMWPAPRTAKSTHSTCQLLLALTDRRPGSRVHCCLRQPPSRLRRDTTTPRRTRSLHASHC